MYMSVLYFYDDYTLLNTKFEQKLNVNKSYFSFKKKPNICYLYRLNIQHLTIV